MIMMSGLALFFLSYICSTTFEDPYYTSKRDRFIWYPMAGIGVFCCFLSLSIICIRYLP